MSRIGIYSGSFNPAHFGHLMVGYTTLVNTPLDALWYSVSPQNPLKDPNVLEDVQHRVEALRHLIDLTHINVAVQPKQLLVTDYELHLPRPSYTYDLLQHLSVDYPQDTFALVIGQDSLYSLRQWKDWQSLVQQYELYVYPRTTSISQDMASFITSLGITKGIHVLHDVPIVNLSSTIIRATQ